MAITIRSLQDICVDYLADKFEHLWTHSKDNQNNIVWCDPFLELPGIVSEKLLYKLSKLRKLNNGTLSLFQPVHTCLRDVTIPDASHITKEGLETLGSHHLLSLDICNSSLALIDVLNCLGSHNLTSLKHLRCKDLKQKLCLEFLSESLPEPYNVCQVCSNRLFPRLDNVCCLSLINIGLTDRCLDIVANNIPTLQSLDISKNFKITNISPLQKHAEWLRVLIMYQVLLLTEVTTVDTLRKLKHLQHLDVSVNVDLVFLDIFQIRSLLMDPSTNPNLTSLDLSGREVETEEMLGTFLDAHPSLSFLGLVGNGACRHPIFDVKSPQYRPGIKVAGIGSLDQIALALRRYHKLRPFNMECIFYQLRLTELSSMTTDNDDIIRALLEVMPFDSNRLHRTVECLCHLEKLLTWCCVSHIQPDTARQLLRACHQVQCLAQSSQQTIEKESCRTHAANIIAICKNLGTD